jgi:hypothetical protein
MVFLEEWQSRNYVENVVIAKDLENDYYNPITCFLLNWNSSSVLHLRNKV